MEGMGFVSLEGQEDGGISHFRCISGRASTIGKVCPQVCLGMFWSPRAPLSRIFYADFHLIFTPRIGPYRPRTGAYGSIRSYSVLYAR